MIGVQTLFRMFTYIMMATLGMSVAHAGTTGKITGQVTDESGLPLPGASVVLEGTKRGCVADEEGIYFLLSVEPRRHTVVAHMIGYESVRKTEILVTSDFTTNVSFVLRERPLELGEIVVEAASGENGWGMFVTKTNAPPVEPDRTASKYLVRSDDFESLTLLNDTAEFVALQGGVTVNADGTELTVRAGDPEDVGYYFDGIPILTNDDVKVRGIGGFNRLAIQEMTVVSGGLNAEYGNSQGGVVSVVTRQGGEHLSGLGYYQITPPGKKHWEPNIYDSAVFQGNMHWDDPNWVSETVMLEDGEEISAHTRQDYTQVFGHHFEGNLGGLLTKDVRFFASGRLKRVASVFPTPDLNPAFDRSLLGKVTWHANPHIRVDLGFLWDRRVDNYIPELYEARGINEEHRLLDTIRPDLGLGGRNIFAINASPHTTFTDSERLVYVSLMHFLSSKTFYEVKIAKSLSKRDTLEAYLPAGIDHISEATTGEIVYDAARYFPIYQNVVAWERFSRNRLIVQGNISSQITKSNFVKAGFELIHFDNWYQQYSSEGPNNRTVAWYGQSYSDTDFFPDKKNKGVTPKQVGLYVQDKLEIDGMIINTGLRYDGFFQDAWVTDALGFGGGLSPMWHSMTRARKMPTVKGNPIQSVNHRIGVSHPLNDRAIIRFFFGKVAQFPDFKHLYYNSWIFNKPVDEEVFDRDLNGNGVLDPAERWNAERPQMIFLGGENRGLQGVFHNPYLKPEETVSFEVGSDWQILQDYVLSLTTYYKSANNQIRRASQQWVDPVYPGAYLFAVRSFTNGIYKDTRGFEFSAKKKFTDMFAFNFSLNLQWADEGSNAIPRRDIVPDSLFVANGHYWVDWDVDPATGAEIPVSLEQKAIREGRDPNYYVELYGGNANRLIREYTEEHLRLRFWSWVPSYSHFAEDGVPFEQGPNNTQFYRDSDKAFWEHVNRDPDYPGHGEGNLLSRQSHETAERLAQVRDRRSYGSLAFLFATPPDYGFLNGKALGDIRVSLVYRFFTGTPFLYQPLELDTRTGELVANSVSQKNGPMHTRTDLNVEKTWGNVKGLSLTVGIEIFNLFNQRDLRSVPSQRDHQVDFDENNWQVYGIDKPLGNYLETVATEPIYDVTSYWDSPREMKFGVQVKW